MRSACGMDFGTSNSTVGAVQGGVVRLACLEDDKNTLPSVIFFNADLDEMSVGRAALNDYLDGYEGRLMRSMKSLLGTSLFDGHTEVLGRRLPYKDLLRHYLMQLKLRAQNNLQQEFEYAVLGRPVHFVDDNTNADRQAEESLRTTALACGFKEVSFQFEPIAAALDYESRLTNEEVVLVVDIGGGTSDFSVVRLSPERRLAVEREQDVLSNTGVHIGGTDFDKALSLACLMPLLGYGGKLANGGDMPNTNYFSLSTWHTINQAYSQKVIRELQDLQHDIDSTDLKLACQRLLRLIERRDGHWLAIQAETAKINLSSELQTVLALDRLSLAHEPGGALQKTIHESELAHALKALVAQIANAVETCLQGAQLRPDQIDSIYFTGGASGVQGLRQKLATLLPDAKQVQGDTFGSIGTGLGWEALRRYS